MASRKAPHEKGGKQGIRSFRCQERRSECLVSRRPNVKAHLIQHTPQNLDELGGEDEVQLRQMLPQFHLRNCGVVGMEREGLG